VKLKNLVGFSQDIVRSAVQCHLDLKWIVVCIVMYKLRSRERKGKKHSDDKEVRGRYTQTLNERNRVPERAYLLAEQVFNQSRQGKEKKRNPQCI